MKRWMLSLIAACLVLAGCAKQEPAMTAESDPVAQQQEAEAAGGATAPSAGTPMEGMTEEQHKNMAGEKMEGMAAGPDTAKADICPVEGGKIKGKANFADYNGRRYYFCCAACPPKFEKEPQKFIDASPEWAEKHSEPIPQ